MPMHAGQRKWCYSATKKINVLVPSNRWGKTTVIAIKHIHANFYKLGIGQGDMVGWYGVDYRTANIAPQSSNTEACFNYVKQIMTSRFPIPQADGSVKNNECLIKWFYVEERTINTPPFAIYFYNNSHIEFRSTGHDKAESLEGKPYGYISYDEGGRSDHLADEMQAHILGRLTDWNGKLDIPSTPDSNSPSILYHFKLYNRGLTGIDPSVYTQEGSVFDNEFLSRENIMETMLLYGWDPNTKTFRDQLGEQVIYGKFVFSGATIYPADDILEAQSWDKTKYGNLSIRDGMPYVPGHKYIIGIDEAIGSDEIVYTVVDTTDESNYEVVNKVWAKGNAKSPQLHIQDLTDLFFMYNQASNVKISLETWNGSAARFYMDMPRELQRVTKCYGSWQPPKVGKKDKKLFNQQSLHVALRKKLAAKALKFAQNDETLSQQLSIYREDDAKLETDHVFSLALAVFQATDGKPKVTVLQAIDYEW